MNFIKRALLSVSRRPGKSALLLAIIFILGVVIAGAISVQQALHNTKEMLADKIGITAKINLNSFALQQLMVEQRDMEVQTLTPDVIEAIGWASQVKSYDYTADFPLTYRPDPDESPSKFTLSCRKNTDFDELQNGKIVIVKGRALNEADKLSKQRPVLISAQAAEQLGITTGAQLELQRDVIYGNEVKDTLKYGFVVVGIFDNAVSQEETGRKSKQTTNGQPVEETVDYSSNVFILMDNASNIVSSINETEERINRLNAQFVSVVPSFVLKSRDDVEGFRRVVGALVPPYYVVADNTEEFDYMTSPTSNMEWIAQIVLLVTVAASVAIISLVVTLSIRDRRREMGTYFSIGERKRNIAMQILFEILAVAIVALSASMLVGSVVASTVSGEMLKTEVVNATQEEQAHVVSTGSIDSQVILESYHVSLDALTIIYFYGAGLLIVTLSTIAPVLYTLRLNPKKILLM